MMDLDQLFSPQRIARIAEQIGRSGAQQQAIMTAMSRLSDDATLLARDDAPGATLAMPEHPITIFVLSGQQLVDNSDRLVRRHLDDALAHFGGLQLVTVGRMGVELDAVKWAANKDNVSVHEFSAVWAIPNADGTTRRNPNARGPRNEKLRRYCEQAIRIGGAYVFAYGVEPRYDRIEQILVRAGARPLRTSASFDERKHTGPWPAHGQQEPMHPVESDIPDDMGAEAPGPVSMPSPSVEGDAGQRDEVDRLADEELQRVASTLGVDPQSLVAA